VVKPQIVLRARKLFYSLHNQVTSGDSQASSAPKQAILLTLEKPAAAVHAACY